MAQWRKIQSLAKSRQEVATRLSMIYRNDRKYLLDIRQSCAEWMESFDWLSYDTTADGMIMRAQGHFQDLLNNIDVVISKSGLDIVKKINLNQAKQYLTDNFSGDLVAFVEVIQQCLRDEKLLIQSCEPDDDHSAAGPSVDRAQENHEVNEKLRQLFVDLQVAERDLADCTDLQNKFKIQYNIDTEHLSQMKQAMEGMQRGPEYDKRSQEYYKRHQDLQNNISTNYQRRTEVSMKHVDVTEKTQTMLMEVWREIEQWKKDKKMEITGISKPKEGIIEILDKMCCQMNQILMQLLAQFDKLVRVMGELKYTSDSQPDFTTQKVQQALLAAENLLKLHLEKVFVVDRNPPRVLKVITGKSLGFTMSCRILGGHALGLQMNPPHVTAELHKEQDLAVGHYSKKGICTVVNGQDKVMEFHREAKQWIAVFNSVQLQSVSQLAKNTEKLVMENLNGMVFTTVLKLRARDYKLTAISLPMVLISHVLQDCQARAFLIWDAAFSEDDTERKLFEHPEQVAWHRVAKVLSALFKENTGRGLRDEHLNYLGRIAFRERKQPDPLALKDRKITKNQLIKDKLQKDFQFWKWFYANMNLIKERLKQEWQDELIFGFIAKDETIKKLSGKPPGTFMLRFSESDIENSNKADICGCLTLAVYERDPSSESHKVYHVKEHLTPKDIFERGLATTLEAFEVKDFENGQKRPLLRYLYPDRDFRQTFNKYIRQKRNRDEGSDGYKGGQLRIEIFLADLPDTHRRRQVSIAQASPMSPTPSVPSPAASDASMPNPLSPGAYPMSPGIESMDETSQLSNGQVAGSEGKRHCRAVGIVQPSQNSGKRKMSASTTAVPNPPVSDFNGLQISMGGASRGMASSQGPIMQTFGTQVSPGNTVVASSVMGARMGAPSRGIAVPSQGVGATSASMGMMHIENIYQNAENTDFGIALVETVDSSSNEVNNGPSILAAMEEAERIAVADAVEFLQEVNSGDIPIDSGESFSGGRSSISGGSGSSGNQVRELMGDDVELPSDLYGFNLGPSQPPHS